MDNISGYEEFEDDEEVNEFMKDFCTQSSLKEAESNHNESMVEHSFVSEKTPISKRVSNKSPEKKKKKSGSSLCNSSTVNSAFKRPSSTGMISSEPTVKVRKTLTYGSTRITPGLKSSLNRSSIATSSIPSKSSNVGSWKVDSVRRPAPAPSLLCSFGSSNVDSKFAPETGQQHHIVQTASSTVVRPVASSTESAIILPSSMPVETDLLPNLQIRNDNSSLVRGQPIVPNSVSIRSVIPKLSKKSSWSLNDDMLLNKAVDDYSLANAGKTPSGKLLEYILRGKTEFPKTARQITSRRHTIQHAKRTGVVNTYKVFNSKTIEALKQLIHSRPNDCIFTILMQFLKDINHAVTFKYLKSKFEDLRSSGDLTLSLFQCEKLKQRVPQWKKVEERRLMSELNRNPSLTPRELKVNANLPHEEWAISAKCLLLKRVIGKYKCEVLSQLSHPTQKINTEIKVMQSSLTKAETFAVSSCKDLQNLSSFKGFVKRLQEDHPSRLITHSDWAEVGRIVKDNKDKLTLTSLVSLIRDRFPDIPKQYIRTKLQTIFSDSDLREYYPFTRPQISMQQLTFQAVVAVGVATVSLDDIRNWIQDKYAYYACVNYDAEIKRILSSGFYCTSVVLGNKFYSIHVDFLSRIEEITTCSVTEFEKFRRFNKIYFQMPRETQLRDCRPRVPVSNESGLEVVERLRRDRDRPHQSVVYTAIFVNKRIKADFSTDDFFLGLSKHPDEIYPFYIGANSKPYGSYGDSSIRLSPHHDSCPNSIVSFFVTQGFDVYQINVEDSSGTGKDAVTASHIREANRILFAQQCLKCQPNSMFRATNLNLEGGIVSLTDEEVLKICDEDAMLFSPIVLHKGKELHALGCMIDIGVLRQVFIKLSPGYLSKLKLDMSKFDRYADPVDVAPNPDPESESCDPDDDVL